MNLRKLSYVVLATAALCGHAEEPLEYRASVIVNASTGRFAPYMIGSWNRGRITNAKGLWHNGEATKKLDLSRRFSWGAGVEYIVGYGNAAAYDRWDNSAKAWTHNYVRQAPARLQQLYGEVKFRGVYLTAGMKNTHSGIVDDRLSSGDLVRSNNAAPIPGVSAGFVDFQDIPFTNGWVQIDGEIMYGKFFDNSYTKNTYNYYDNLIATGLWYTYKRCYFRTKPSERLSVTVGMQTAGEFAGTTTYYSKGEVYRHDDRGFHLRDLWDMFFPNEGSGEGYYKGNSLGSWDLKARYSLKNGSEITAYFEWPWEDGSGIGRRNGWDGVWGLQYNFAKESPVSAVLFEYIDFTNQGGPVHYSHTDAPGTNLNGHATGGDNYYNNDFYGPYANYGLGIGSAFPVAPLYNQDGSVMFLRNRCRGFHAAVCGELPGRWTYRALVSYQKAGGSGRRPAMERLQSTSAMVEASWRPLFKMQNLLLKAQVAFDAGKLRGNNFGAMASVSWTGSLNFLK